MRNDNGAMVYTNNRYRFKVSSVIYYILITGALFSTVSLPLPIFISYFDEILVLYILLKYMRTLATNKPNKYDMQFLAFEVSILFVGIISNFSSGYIIDYKYIILNYFVFSKPFIVAYCGIRVFKNCDLDDLSRLFYPIAKMLFIIAFIFAFIYNFADFGMRGQYRYFIYCYNFIFNYAHCFVTVMFFSAAVIIRRSNRLQRKRLVIVLLCVFLVLTTKGTSLVSVVAMVFFVLYKRTNNKYLGFMMLSPILVYAIVFISRFQIQHYILTEDSARAILLSNAIGIAKKYLPFGTGFGTYGSDIAAKIYSKVYMDLGFDSIWGLSKSTGYFLDDNYWPMVIGQFGLIGVFLTFISFLYPVKKLIKKLLSYNKVTYNEQLIVLILIYLLTMSLGSAYITSGYGAIAIICIYMVINMKQGAVNNE